MIEFDCGVPEERWIDWHLKRLPPETVWAMERHLAACSACRRVHRQWGEWLKRPGTAESEAEDRAPLPSERVRKSLRFAVWRRGWRKRLTRRPVWMAGAALAVFVALAGLLWRAVPDGPGPEAGSAGLDPMEYARLHEPEGAALMTLPDTKVYSKIPEIAPGLPEAGGRRTVTVWVNGRTGEMFVLLEGLLPAGSRDVQAWIGFRQRLINLGLLEFHQAQGHLYSPIRNLPEVKEVAFTIEPKGGSREPTAPEAARVRLAGNP